MGVVLMKDRNAGYLRNILEGEWVTMKW
jgi:hypothetical protein